MAAAVITMRVTATRRTTTRVACCALTPSGTTSLARTNWVTKTTTRRSRARTRTPRTPVCAARRWKLQGGTCWRTPRARRPCSATAIGRGRGRRCRPMGACGSGPGPPRPGRGTRQRRDAVGAARRDDVRHRHVRPGVGPPVVRLFGLTEQGNSVLVNVRGFSAVTFTRTFDSDNEAAFTCNRLEAYLQTKYGRSKRNYAPQVRRADGGRAEALHVRGLAPARRPAAHVEGGHGAPRARARGCATHSRDATPAVTTRRVVT